MDTIKDKRNFEDISKMFAFNYFNENKKIEVDN